MALFRIARRTLCAAAEAAAPVPTPTPAPTSRLERLKNSKAGVWIRGMATDYKEAFRELFVGARERPLKASVYATVLGGSLACFYTKPDRSSFDAAVLDRSNQLGLLSPWIRSATSDGHVQNLLRLHSEGRLRHISLAFLSLVYRADYDSDVELYEAQCSNVSVPWKELPQRVLDVGVAGRWWVLDSKMKDYDVNEEEFKALPAHMQATSVPSVKEVETSERLHKESAFPLAEKDGEEETKAVDRKEESVGEESPVIALEEQQSQA